MILTYDIEDVKGVMIIPPGLTEVLMVHGSGTGGLVSRDLDSGFKIQVSSSLSL